MPPAIARGLEQAGLADGAKPENWYGCFGPVVVDDWTALEKYEDGRWVEGP